jgi:hypothetical protein
MIETLLTGGPPMSTPIGSMSPEELVELARLESLATPGPWTVRFSINVECGDGLSPLGAQSTHFDGTARAEANAAFIAAARNALPRLLALLAARPTTARDATPIVTVVVEPGFKARSPMGAVPTAVGAPDHYDNNGQNGHPVEECRPDKCGFPAGGGVGGQLIGTVTVAARPTAETIATLTRELQEARDAASVDKEIASRWHMNAVEVQIERDRLKIALAEARGESGRVTDRCLVTGNPCGTDTWQVDHPCQCAPCRRLVNGGKP